MKARRRNFLLLAALAAMAAAPGFGQAAPAATMPDFSGMWAHPWLPGYEPLASGPTSLTNRSRRDGVSNPLQLVGDYTNPILKPETAATVKKFGEMSISLLRLSQSAQPVLAQRAALHSSSNGMEIFQKRDEITMIYQVDHQVRRVRMNQPHPAR